MNAQFANFPVGAVIHLNTAAPTELFRILKKGPKSTVVVCEDGTGRKVLLHNHVAHGPYLAQ